MARARAARTPPAGRSSRTPGCARRSPTSSRKRSSRGSTPPPARWGRARCCSTWTGRFQSGADEGVAPARNAIVDQDGKPLGRIVTSVDSATSFATRLERLAEVGVVVIDGDDVIGASRPELSGAELPAKGSITVDGQELRVATLGVGGFDGQDLTMRVTRPAT